MKFFLDTGNLNEIREAASLGILDGITTNPSLVAKEGIDFRELLQEIVEIVDGPISAEVVATDHQGMLREGRELARIHPNIVVKVPMMAEGLKALKIFRAEGIRVNVTLVFSAAQALLAAKGGATFVSPFIGRLDDIAETGMDLVRDIVQIYRNYDFETEILVASIRNPVHVVEAAKAGAGVATMPYKVFMQLLKHPLSDIGLENFLKDWEKARKHELQVR